MSYYDLAIARVQEIESRLGLLNQPPAAFRGYACRGSRRGKSVAVGFPVSRFRRHQAAVRSCARAGGGQCAVSADERGKRRAFAPYIESLISKYAGQNGIPPGLVRAVIRQESDGNPHDVSHAGARGLMQLMPDEIHELGVTDPFDPEQNIAAGTRLLSGLLKQYKGDTPLALAAYNAGSGAVQKYNGIPPYKETQNYVKKIMGMLDK